MRHPMKIQFPIIDLEDLGYPMGIAPGHPARVFLGLALLMAMTGITVAGPQESSDDDVVSPESPEEEPAEVHPPEAARPKGHDGLISDSEPLSSGPWTTGVSPDKQQQARILFIEGNTLMKDAFPTEAAARYLAALAIWEHPAIYFNLAMAQRLLDKPVEAHKSLERAMRHGDGPIGTQKYLHAQRTLETLESTLGRIEIIFPEPGGEVTIDGKVVLSGSGRTEVVVRVGSHQVAASKPGRIPFSQSVEVEASGLVRVVPELRWDSRLEARRRWARWKPWSVAGAGALVLASGAVLARSSGARVDEFDRQFEGLCPTGCQRDELSKDLTSLEDRAGNLRITTIAAYTLGTATLATAAVLLYMNREVNVNISQEYDDTRPGLSIHPSISDGAVTGIAIETSFSF